MVQTLTPDATLTPSDWLLVGAASKHAAVVADDGDSSYLYTLTGLSQTQALGLPAAVDPIVHTGHQLVCVYRCSTGSARVGLQLYQGATAITGVERSDPGTSEWATLAYTLSEAEAGAITDYADLRLHVVSPAGAVTGFELRVTYAAVVIPDYSAALVTWTLAEGASDAVASALSSGINAKLAAVNARYADGVTVPDVAAGSVYQSARALAGPVEHWPAIGVWAVSGSVPMVHGAGHALGTFRVRVVCLVRGQDDADDVQRQAQRLALAVLETLRDAYVAGGGLSGWDLVAEVPQVQYSSREIAQSTWTGEAAITLGLSKLEAI